MVRVKYRYILVEVLTDQYKNRLKLPLLEKELREAILQSVELLHGNYGLACVQSSFAIKMYNPATRVLILRVRRKFHSLLCSSMPFVSTFAVPSSAKTLRGSLRTLHLSGTIRSAFKFLIQHDKVKLAEMVKIFSDVPKVEQQLSGIIEKCHKRLGKRRLDVP